MADFKDFVEDTEVLMLTGVQKSHGRMQSGTANGHEENTNEPRMNTDLGGLQRVAWSAASLARPVEPRSGGIFVA